MKIENLLQILGSDFYAGVPDSQLRALCNYLYDTYGVGSSHHVVAANEGNAVALAAGYHLATRKIPVVYMQNSGEGNALNPVASLLNEKVYAIPTIFIIGWRGEPGVHDEPQHIFQGEITLPLLETLCIQSYVIGKETTDAEVEEAMARFNPLLAQMQSVAFVVQKNALQYDRETKYQNNHCIRREDAIKQIARAAGKDPIVCTTGKASRELFEIRENESQGHQQDFLTVGSMGHCSSIALGIALQQKNRRIWCIDGDGAALMHMGAMGTIGTICPRNLIHIVINNEAHESVGGLPTAMKTTKITEVARACGYRCAYRVSCMDELKQALEDIKEKRELCLVEILCSLDVRKDLGRPTISAVENKKHFMRYLM